MYSQVQAVTTRVAIETDTALEVSDEYKKLNCMEKM